MKRENFVSTQQSVLIWVLHAAKGAITLNATSHKRAIDEVLNNGNALSISMALNSSPTNAKLITARAQSSPLLITKLSKLSADWLNSRLQSILTLFLKELEHSANKKHYDPQFFALPEVARQASGQPPSVFKPK